MRSRKPTTPLSGLRGERRRGFSVFRLDSRAEKYMMTATLAISEGWKVGPATRKAYSHRCAPLMSTPRGVSTRTSRTTAAISRGMDSTRKS